MQLIILLSFAVVLLLSSLKETLFYTDAPLEKQNKVMIYDKIVSAKNIDII